MTATIATHGSGRQLGILAEALSDAGNRVVDYTAGDACDLVVDIADEEPVQEEGAGVVEAALVEHFPEAGRRVLSLLVGGDEADFRRVEAACGAAVHAVLHAGPHGAAHKSRALIHTMYLTLKSAAEEIVAVAAEHDVGAAEILGIINKSSGESLASKALYSLATEPAGGNADIGSEIEAAMHSDLCTVLDMAADADMSGFFARRVYDRQEIKGRKAL